MTQGIDWALVKSTLEECARPLIPLPAISPPYEPRWQHGSDGNLIADPATGWKVFFRIGTLAEVSAARRYSTPESDPDRLDEEIATLETLTVELRCEADFHDDDAYRWAVKVVEHIKKGFRLSACREKLRAANMAVQDMLDIVDVSFDHEGRTVNAYSLDMLFSIASCFGTVEQPAGVDWFNTVILSSDIREVGEDAPVPHRNFTDTVITANGVA